MGGGALIFVTTGSMLPFDRLVQAVDQWIGGNEHGDAFAQIGRSQYRPVHMFWQQMLSPAEFRRRLDQALLVVSHAGMGTVISALEASKPMVLLPRRAAAGEVTTDHQIHTARWLSKTPGIFVAVDEGDVARTIERALSELDKNPPALAPKAPAEFIENIRRFLLSDAP